MKEISFETYFRNILDSTSENNQKLSIIFLVELLKYNESVHIKNILGDIMDNLTEYKISPTGILTFWKILIIVMKKNDDDKLKK